MRGDPHERIPAGVRLQSDACSSARRATSSAAASATSASAFATAASCEPLRSTSDTARTPSGTSARTTSPATTAAGTSRLCGLGEHVPDDLAGERGRVESALAGEDERRLRQCARQARLDRDEGRAGHEPRADGCEAAGEPAGRPRTAELAHVDAVAARGSARRASRAAARARRAARPRRPSAGRRCVRPRRTSSRRRTRRAPRRHRGRSRAPRARRGRRRSSPSRRPRRSRGWHPRRAPRGSARRCRSSSRAADRWPLLPGRARSRAPSRRPPSRPAAPTPPRRARRAAP